MGPIDQPDWTSFAVDGNELPVTVVVVAWECSLKTAVFLSSVTRSIASEHKMIVTAKIAAIIRRSIEGVTAAAPGYSPMPAKAVLSPAADAHDRCERSIFRASTKASSRIGS